MATSTFEIRLGSYFDSVILMHLQRALLDLPGVLDAGVVMATPANLILMAESDLLPTEAQKANPEDLLIVVRAEEEDQATSAIAAIDDLMAKRRSTSAGKFRPRSLEAAFDILPEARFVLISVPGRYAAGLAEQALRGNRHVFLYSDNVSMEEEARLKAMAQERGLLVMGPDCGTAIVQGIGLGFANRVRSGGVGLIGAAGTGLQAVTSRIHQLGAGISHALGTGGRDLKKEIGGVTALQSLDLLKRDSETRVIVMVSKPPDPEVATKLLSAARNTRKPVVVNFIGYSPPARKLGNLHFASNFNEAASLAVDLLGENNQSTAAGATSARQTGNDRRYIRGLFSGGSLASEALLLLQVMFGKIYSNFGGERLGEPTKAREHTLLDLGEDQFTVGRLHPMIDNDLRLRMFRQEAANPEVAFILLDMVLGEGAHIDPAGEFAPVIAEVLRQHAFDVGVILIGTDEDPQDYDHQRQQLLDAGARVFGNVLEAANAIGSLLGGPSESIVTPVDLEDLAAPLAAINVGLEAFYESLEQQGAKVVQVNWRPPAGGNEKLMSILQKMRD